MFQSIKEIVLKIKGLCFLTKGEVLVFFIMLLVGLGSFGLGRISVNLSQETALEDLEEGRVVVTDKDRSYSKENTDPEKSNELGSVVVASKTGKKYHFPWCAGAKQISEKNKITFSSVEEAREAGYMPANNCKGLK